LKPLKTLTNGRPLRPGAQITSEKPSPLTSPEATKTPPLKLAGKAMKLPMVAKLKPLKIFTCGPPPGPAAVMMSAKPSRFTSPDATRTPPVKTGS
jgi:hypothetical protein